MKIAVIENLPQGGAKRVVLEEIRYLSKKHQVKHFELNFELKGFRLIKDFHNFVSLSLEHKKLAQEIDSLGFDVCLVHPSKLTQAIFTLRYLNTPSLYYCHELLRIAYEKELAFNLEVPWYKKYYEQATRIIRKRIDRKNAKSANLIVANSKYTAKKIKKVYNRKADVIYPGVDEKVFKPYKLAKKNQLLFVGEENEINGYPFAKRIANEANLNLKVVKGFKLSDKELAKEYSQSLATLCTSYNEPFGMAATESIACGTPVLAVNDGGYKETVVNSKNGFLLPRKEKFFVEKLSGIKSLRKGDRYFRDLIKSNFSWEKHGFEIERKLRSLL